MSDIRFYFVAGSLLFVSIFSEAASGRTVRISKDCASWTSVSSGNLQQVTFAEVDDSKLYFDYPRKMYATLTGKRAPFIYSYAEAGWIHVATEKAIESIPFSGTASNDDVVHLMTTVVGAASQILNSNRWVLYPDKGTVVALFLAKRCSEEPKAIGVSCSVNSKECSLLPIKLSKEGVAQKCIHELDLKTTAKIMAVKKACQTFASNSYRDFKNDLSSKTKSCGANSIQLPTAKKVSETCKAADKFFE